VTAYCDKAVTSTVTNCVSSKVHTGLLVKNPPSVLNLASSLVGLLNVEERSISIIATLAGLSLMAAALAFGPLRENIDKSRSKLKELKQYYHTNDLKNRIEGNIEKLEENLISANKCGKNLINASFSLL